MLKNLLVKIINYKFYKGETKLLLIKYHLLNLKLKLSLSNTKIGI